MNLNQFETSITELFSKEMLKEFHDDFGFTNRSNDSISTVGYCTNLSIDVIEKAAENQVDLLITHHDAWDFIYGLREQCSKKLKEYNISHFWIHGPLDFIEFGTCTSLMNVMGIDSIKKYSSYINGDTPGIGEFNVPTDFHSLVERMRNELNEPVRAWRNNEKEIKRVGVLTGAGHATDYMKVAFEEGCDTYITGEATLYTIQYAQFVRMNLLVGSHTFTEIYGLESLVNKLRKYHDGIHTIKLEEEHIELNHR